MPTSRLARNYPRIPPDVVELVLRGHALGDEALACRILNRITSQQIEQLRQELRQLPRTHRPRDAGPPHGYDEPAAIDVSDAMSLFETCKAHGIEEGGEESVDAIQGSGLVSLCEELGVDPFTDPFVLVFAWLGKAETPYQITRAEFTRALRRAECGTVALLQQRVGDIRKLSATKFCDFYTFAFRWNKPVDQRALELDMAIELWKVVMSMRPWGLQDAWCKFLHERKTRGISKDVWREYLRFTTEHAEGVANYDFDGGAWPVVFDEFVEHVQKGAQ